MSICKIVTFLLIHGQESPYFPWECPCYLYLGYGIRVNSGLLPGVMWDPDFTKFTKTHRINCTRADFDSDVVIGRVHISAQLDVHIGLGDNLVGECESWFRDVAALCLATRRWVEFS